MNIIILGPQGSGKGTQAKLVSEKFGFLHLSTGELIRALARKRPDVDERVNKKGQLLPDNETLRLVTGYLEKMSRFDGVIFDGFPRTVNQYGLLKSYLAQKGKKVDIGIFLDISEKEIIKRLSGRRVDTVTGKTYNLITNPPGPEVDTKNLVQRADDTEEAIKARLGEYSKNTIPLIEKLSVEGILVRLNGERPIEEIFQDIAKLLESKK